MPGPLLFTPPIANTRNPIAAFGRAPIFVMLCLLPTLLAFAPGLTPKPHFATSLVAQQGRAVAPVRLDLHSSGIVPFIDDSAVVPIAAAALAFFFSATVVSNEPKTAQSPPPLPPPSPPSPDPALAAKAASEKKAREAEAEASVAEKNARELEAARAEAAKKAKEADTAEAAAAKAREAEFEAAAAERKAREAEAAAAAERRELEAAKAAAETKAKREAAPPPAPKEVVNPWGSQLPPTWTDLTQVPVRVPNQAAWNSLGRAKQLAILCRLSVVHLTVISCGVPCMLAGATGTATGLVAPLVWVVSLIMWHLSHNMINDAQDLRRGLDENRNAFRLQYGTHALAEGFVSTRSFGITLGAISAAAVAGSALLAGKLAPACAWAFPVGLAATLLYTPLAKPFGLGELLVLLVWGPAMFGGGWSAATGIPAAQVARSVPVALGAFGMIMGKHIDKLDECRDEGVNTLPVLLGDKRARALAAAALVGQHVSLIALVAARKMPPGALLALAAAPFELRGALDVLRNGRPATAAGAKPSYRGSMLPFVPARSWPLWHVAAAGWHAVTFGYWLMAGLGVSWAARTFCLAMA